MTDKPTLKLISDGGLVVHYHDYHKRCHYFVPMCGLGKHRDWRLDDGVGAEICARCVTLHQRRQETVAKNRKARRMREYYRNRDRRIEGMRRYREASREALRLKARIYGKKRRRRKRDLMTSNGKHPVVEPQHNYNVPGHTVWTVDQIRKFIILYKRPQMVHEHRHGEACNEGCYGVILVQGKRL